MQTDRNGGKDEKKRIQTCSNRAHFSGTAHAPHVWCQGYFCASFHCVHLYLSYTGQGQGNAAYPAIADDSWLTPRMAQQHVPWKGGVEDESHDFVLNYSCSIYEKSSGKANHGSKMKVSRALATRCRGRECSRYMAPTSLRCAVRGRPAQVRAILFTSAELSPRPHVTSSLLVYRTPHLRATSTLSRDDSPLQILLHNVPSIVLRRIRRATRRGALVELRIFIPGRCRGATATPGSLSSSICLEGSGYWNAWCIYRLSASSYVAAFSASDGEFMVAHICGKAAQCVD